MIEETHPTEVAEQSVITKVVRSTLDQSTQLIDSIEKSFDLDQGPTGTFF